MKKLIVVLAAVATAAALTMVVSRSRSIAQEDCIRIELPAMGEDERLVMTSPTYGLVLVPGEDEDERWEYGQRVVLPCREGFTTLGWSMIVSDSTVSVSGHEGWSISYVAERDVDRDGKPGRAWDRAVAIAEEVGCDNWPATRPSDNVSIECES